MTSRKGPLPKRTQGGGQDSSHLPTFIDRIGICFKEQKSTEQERFAKQNRPTEQAHFSRKLPV